MLLGWTLPASWRGLLAVFRPVFARSWTFGVFTVLATGLVARVSRRSVVGMLAGAGMAAVVSFHSACRFFSQGVWDLDRLGLALARLIVARLLPAEAPIEVVVDDSLFRRWGRKVHHAFWTHDGAAQGPVRVGRGNRWIIAGIVIELPFCSHPVCLPVLFRLWAGKGTASPVDLAAELLALLTTQFTDRRVHGVGDAAYHGRALLVPGLSWTTRLPSNAALYDLAPPRNRRRLGRPRLKGDRFGRPGELAAGAIWSPMAVSRYGQTKIAEIAEIGSIWHGAFGNTPGRTVLVREPGLDGYELAIFTTDLDTPTVEIVARYADRWSIETAIATGKQILGVGQARNRTPRAVERTVGFGFCIQSLVIIWYALHGHHPDDLNTRHAAEPWYPGKTEPAFEDMLAKLRRTLIAARFNAVSPTQPDPAIIQDYARACAAAAAA